MGYKGYLEVGGDNLQLIDISITPRVFLRYKLGRMLGGGGAAVPDKGTL